MLSGGGRGAGGGKGAHTVKQQVNTQVKTKTPQFSFCGFLPCSRCNICFGFFVSHFEALTHFHS